MITLRSIIADDWKKLKELNEIVFSENSEFDSNFINNWPSFPESETYFKALTKDGVCGFVAEEDTKIVGYVSAHVTHHIWSKTDHLEIEILGVIPEYRKKGVAQLLINKCLDWAKEKGIKVVTVNSYIENMAADSFYKKNGFVPLDIKYKKEL